MPNKKRLIDTKINITNTRSSRGAKMLQLVSDNTASELIPPMTRSRNRGCTATEKTMHLNSQPSYNLQKNSTHAEDTTSGIVQNKAIVSRALVHQTDITNHSLLLDSVATLSSSLLDVASNIIVQERGADFIAPPVINEIPMDPIKDLNILAEDSDDSFVENSNSSDVLYSTQTRGSVCILPSESEESYLIPSEEACLKTPEELGSAEKISMNEETTYLPEHNCTLPSVIPATNIMTATNIHNLLVLNEIPEVTLKNSDYSVIDNLNTSNVSHPIQTQDKVCMLPSESQESYIIPPDESCRVSLEELGFTKKTSMNEQITYYTEHKIPATNIMTRTNIPNLLVLNEVPEVPFKNSDYSFIDNSNTSNVSQSAQTQEKGSILPSETQESYNIPPDDLCLMTPEEQGFTKKTSMSEQITYHPEHKSAPKESTATNIMTDSCIPNDLDDRNSSEYDDSDRDTTFYPSSRELSNDDETVCENVDENEVSEAVDPPTEPRRCTRVRELQSMTSTYTEEINSAPTNDGDRRKTTRIRIRDYCFFCETDVLNFSRHVERNHQMEPEVQKILSYPKNSNIRKNLFTSLRKKGNYITNVSKCVKPMKKSKVYPEIEYLPCQNCLGFYSRKQLWKHKKACLPLATTSNAQVEAQNFMLRNLNVDSKLKNEVFPKMRPDKVSLEAKKDPIICAFGSQYLRIHREKHFINVTSRKMRELAKLLIEIKKLKSSVGNLMDCLKPQNYDIIVTATKKVSNYDHKADRYGAPTYAMNIGTSLKQCCNIAIMATLKSDSNVSTATKEADFKTLIQLIEANWKFDISNQAASDLNLKKWNKITIVPLASDLKLLKNHLSEKAAIASSKLASSKTSNVEAYNTLVETVYCRVIILNRRRPGELQRLLLNTYQECSNNNNAYEEFNRAISSTEKLLVNSFKRVVIRGKRGRGVPVLFTDDIQRDITLLLSVRHQYISDNNEYLFAKLGNETSLCGYKVLEKYAKSCGAKNPKALTSTKLRKHLATLTQMLNLKDTDIEQLANFMGHTQSVHRQNYRLPDDVYQTAKISKLLLLMESGKADSYKGKALDDIELDLEQNLLEEARNEDDNNEDDIVEYDVAEPVNTQFTESSTSNILIPEKNQPKVLEEVTNVLKNAGKKKRNLVPWTSQQKEIVLTFFKKHINSKRPPKRHECEELRSKHPEIMRNKDWLKIKVFVQNTYTKKC